MYGRNLNENIHILLSIWQILTEGVLLKSVDLFLYLLFVHTFLFLISTWNSQSLYSLDVLVEEFSERACFWMKIALYSAPTVIYVMLNVISLLVPTSIGVQLNQEWPRRCRPIHLKRLRGNWHLDLDTNPSDITTTRGWPTTFVWHIEINTVFIHRWVLPF